MSVKFIVKWSVSYGVTRYWLAETKGTTFVKSEAYKYSREELVVHQFSMKLKWENVVLIPVEVEDVR